MLLKIFAAADAMTASGQEPRRHHVVPRFYLERWAQERRVKVTELDARASHTVDPKNALVETDFYRIPAGGAEGSNSPVVWEAWLSKIEGNAKTVFDKMDAVGFAELAPTELGHIAVFVGVQATRSRAYRYQARWMSTVALHQVLELHRPGAIEAQMRRAGMDPTRDEVIATEEEWARTVDDPWQMNTSVGWEMEVSQAQASDLADLLATRSWVAYETSGPLITSDEPVVGLYEHMGADHLQDGGYHGAPVLVFPLGPHQVLAMFRENMPVQRPPAPPLDWRDTLDLNRAIAGNAHRYVVSQPSSRLAESLRIPERKAPSEIRRSGRNGNEELVRFRALTRWSDERDAPRRPVGSWWPRVVPPAPPPPRSRDEHRDERGR